MLVRATAWRLLQASRSSSVLFRQPTRAESVGRRFSTSVVAALGAVPPIHPNGRPSKTAAKVEAKQFADLSRQLAKLSKGQLVRLTPLVGEDVVEAVALAARISHRNQGRQRQEGLVAKRLREAFADGNASPDQLQTAIESVRTGQGVIANPAVERQVQLWQDALLGGEEEAATLVFGLVQGSGAADLQQLRQLLRQAQLTEAPPAPAASSSVDDEAAAAEAAPAAAAGGRSTAPRPTAKALAARRQLRKLLQPLAEGQVAAAAAEEVKE